MTLHCEKTGHHRPAATFQIARQQAREKGLVDWSFCPEETAPATMGETVDAMRAAREEAHG